MLRVQFLVTAEAESLGPGVEEIAEQIHHGLVELLTHDLVRDTDGKGYTITAWGIDPKDARAELRFVVRVGLHQSSGDEVNPDQLSEQVRVAIDASNPEEIYVANSEFSVTTWDVTRAGRS